MSKRGLNPAVYGVVWDGMGLLTARRWPSAAATNTFHFGLVPFSLNETKKKNRKPGGHILILGPRQLYRHGHATRRGFGLDTGGCVADRCRVSYLLYDDVVAVAVAHAASTQEGYNGGLRVKCRVCTDSIHVRATSNEQ
jgi:hypothetical protein